MTTWRRSSRPLRRRGARVPVTGLAALLAFVLGVVIAPAQLVAQNAIGVMHFPPRPPPPARQPPPPSNAPMLVQATEIRYDYTNNSVAAVGNVQIYYGGATVEADQVIYDQGTKRLRAEGNVRLSEEDGKVTYGEIMDLSDDYRDGFVDSLRLDTPDQTRMAAARAELWCQWPSADEWDRSCRRPSGRSWPVADSAPVTGGDAATARTARPSPTRSRPWPSPSSRRDRSPSCRVVSSSAR